jgi:hypothetical protein
LKDATKAFRHAVGVAPGYGLGWFNMGVALERTSLRTCSRRKAHGRAFRADPDLRGRRRAFVADDDLYSQPRPLAAAAGVGVRPFREPHSGRCAGSRSRSCSAPVRRSALAPAWAATRWLEIGRDALARLPSARVDCRRSCGRRVLAVFLLPLLRARDSSATSAPSSASACSH